MHRVTGLDVHKAHVYGYELKGCATSRDFRFPNIPEVRVPAAPMRELRVSIKHRYGLMRRRTMFKNC